MSNNSQYVPWEVVLQAGKKHCPPNRLYVSALNMASRVRNVLAPVFKKVIRKVPEKQPEPPKQAQKPKVRQIGNGSYNVNGFVCFQIRN